MACEFLPGKFYHLTCYSIHIIVIITAILYIFIVHVGLICWYSYVAL